MYGLFLKGRLDSLSDQAQSIIDRLAEASFMNLRNCGEAIDKALNTIALHKATAVSRRTHIGIYRNNSEIVDQVKEDIERLEKQLEIIAFYAQTGGVGKNRIKNKVSIRKHELDDPYLLSCSLSAC